jgi:hypothetical protein
MLYARHDLTGLLPIISPSHGDRTECPSSTALDGKRSRQWPARSGLCPERDTPDA